MDCNIDIVNTTGLLQQVLATTPCPEKKKAARAKAAAPKAKKAAATDPDAATAATKAEPKIKKVSAPGIVKIKVVVNPALKALAFFSKDASGLGPYKDAVLAALTTAAGVSAAPAVTV